MNTEHTQTHCDICGREPSLTQIKFKVIVVNGSSYVACDACYVAYNEEASKSQ